MTQTFFVLMEPIDFLQNDFSRLRHISQDELILAGDHAQDLISPLRRHIGRRCYFDIDIGDQRFQDENIFFLHCFANEIFLQKTLRRLHCFIPSGSPNVLDIVDRGTLLASIFTADLSF